MERGNVAVTVCRPRGRKGARPPVIAFVDEVDRACVRVPLDPHGRAYATVLEHDYRRLRKIAGTLSPWFLHDNGKGQRYVRMSVPTANDSGTTPVMIARLIAEAAPKSTIYYVNKDRLDLRPENLFWGRKGKSKHRASDIVQRGLEARRERQERAQ